MKLTTEVSAKKEQYGTILVTVHDKYGNEIKKIEQGVDSFNRQMWRAFFQWATDAPTNRFPLTRLDGTSITTSTKFGSMVVDGSINLYNGIVIGSGSNPTTYDKVTMDSIIQHSSLGTTDTAQAQETTIEYVNSDRTATITRSFLNLSASPITVNEVGISAWPSTGTGSLNQGFLYVRDVLESSISFDFEQILTVQYKVTIASGTYNYSNMFIQSQFGTNRSNTAIQMTNTTNVMVNVVGLGFYTTFIAGEETSAGFITNTGNTNQSIILGTGNSAFSLTQLDLDSRVMHGSGAGQLFYHPANFTNMVENSTTNSMRFTINRTVENRSGSNITISEVGMFKSAGTSRYLLDRKVITPVTITNGSTLSFTWEFCYEV
jgi:hypothetical protein